ncbi:flagellinolysin [uncultured Massilia sp.]|uniref:flagellinolysin n=1 Tax=uncultured Massilia sp. TaxID=169973 RepID=UPI0025F1A7ED|nr:flagellinolysin [uncultured Massilia sp.]
MSLSIRNDSLSLQAQHRYAEHVSDANTLVARLASGTRIGAAADDPAGQALAARMASGLKGMSEAMRNINDATSMLQVAEGAMSNVTDSLQRLRELAVASGNGSYGDGDRDTLQREANQILQQITQVGRETEFNGQAVFAQETTSIGGDGQVRNVLDGLRTGWLGASEDLVRQYYGIEGKGAKLTVNLLDSDGAGGVLASVSGNRTGMALNIDMADFGSAATADGGKAPQYSDRVIAHEMVHAVMLSSTSFDFDGADWFAEGTAELIQGADERLAGDIAAAGGAANVVAGFRDAYKYSGGYAASRYLHDQLKALGVDGGIKGVMQYMSGHMEADLSTALNVVSKGRYADVGAFEADFEANGAHYIATRMNLQNADTGAIGGLDADAGPVRSARDVVQDAAMTSRDKPLRNFDVTMPENGGHTNTRRVQVQAGADAADLIELQFSAMNASALGLADLDMGNTAVAVSRIDEAIDFVDRQRVAAGASSNRLDMASANAGTMSVNLAAARDRIQDVDYASTTVKLTRAQILQQAASAILTQANGAPRAVLALLKT